MAKKHDLLFELLAKAKRDRQAQQEQGLSGEPGPADDTQQTAAPSDKPVPPARTTGPGEQLRWLAGSEIRINGYTVAIAVTVLLLAFFCGFVVGRKSAPAWQSDRVFEELKRRPPHPEVTQLTPPTRQPEKVDVPERTPATVVPGERVRQPGQKITRKQGLNYLIIESFGDRDRAERARAFLEKSGITTTIDRSGRLFRLVSTVGFERTETSERNAFKSQILSLGRQYQHRAGSAGTDFKTCFYKKWLTDE